ncbi:MAG: hypothetical protein IJT18_08540 [Oscillospiraceae bacterium]|nr:hypothetical protein [Oscillospiraceae bacterium]
MNEERFMMFETALPEEFAEEAHRPLPKKQPWLAVGALAACLAVAAAVYFTVPQFAPDRMKTTTTAEEATAETEDVAMMRTAVTSEAAPEAAEEAPTTYGASAKTESVAQDGAEDAGSGASRAAINAPADAVDVENIVACGEDAYSSYEETIFRVNGVRCTVRRQAVRPEAALDETVNGTSAELQSELAQSAEGAVDGVPAVLRWNEGQEGQILWQYGGEQFCLTMDEGASFAALTDLAEQVFVTVTE